jgi:osmotically-inducible protein OsmY
MTRQTLLAFATACALASTAFAQGANYTLRNGNISVTGSTLSDTSSSSATASAAAQVDQQLLTNVVTALATDPAMAGARIEVQVAEGRVTLSGVALNTAQQEQARAIADRVAGSANVTNRMTTGG